MQKDNPASVYLATLAPTGRRSLYSQLKLVLKVLGVRSTVERYNWATLGYAQFVTIRANLLEQGRSPHSVNLALAALRGTMQCAFHLELVDADCVLRVKAVRRVVMAAGPRDRSLTTADVRKLLSCSKNDRTPIGIRDTALLAVLVCTGMRRAELCMLSIDDYDLSRGFTGPREIGSGYARCRRRRGNYWRRGCRCGERGAGHYSAESGKRAR